MPFHLAMSSVFMPDFILKNHSISYCAQTRKRRPSQHQTPIPVK